VVYDIEAMDLKRMSGLPFQIVVRLAESSLFGPLLEKIMFAQIGLTEFREYPSDEGLLVSPPLPHIHVGLEPNETTEKTEFIPGVSATLGFPFETCSDFHQAYKDGRCTPVDVAKRVLDAVLKSEKTLPAMRIFISQNPDDLLAQAKASAERWKDGKTLSILDGIPVAIKDEVDQKGYPTTVGTSFLANGPAKEDGSTVAALRAAGALLIGKANMHEIGIGVTGLNAHHGTARNPYNPSHSAGGSSTGSAAAVAAGLGPFALGADGGGSIRIPAALCGMVGLKATFGRISEHGAWPLCWSVAHLGPIANCAKDAALAYSLMAGPDPKDPNSLRQPTPRFPDFEKDPVKGLKIGVFKEWFEDADPEVVEKCRALISEFEKRGAEVVPIQIPELALVRVIQLVTIASEMAASQHPYMKKHGRSYGRDVRLNLCIARAISATDYVHAQRLRVKVCQHFADTLKEVDVIATPSTGVTAPPLLSDALAVGESNLPLLDKLMRFAPAGNVTGLPAISMPAGYDAAGLPIGLQLIGRPWEEHSLLEVAHLADQIVERKKPAVHFSLLEG
jgi:Asp-tRNA(Asn)/Glu-tRNA(Gln) amidotransferase A subunit family amidase